ncbi:protein kinase domain-containing protein, partial [Klebsiella pneumoniae]|uniref:protein kinase domain-containing protein n=1 Tax=Klebsiella pneumoniae TaxID=573 RepID=UPI0013A58106
VHRDFKPENAIRGDDGVVRVLDFGLAQPAGERLVSELEPATVEISAPHVTRTGAIVGTPAYMAPEQFEGAAADERSDQFAFCVALW